MKKFDKLYSEITHNYWHEPFIGSIPMVKCKFYKEPVYLDLYNALICEDYNIFPVPRRLMNDILDFALTHNTLDEKTYQCQEIIDEYIIDWEYYNQFKKNIQLMLSKNCNCSITVVLYETIDDLLKILNKYKNNNVKHEVISHYELNKQLDNGIAYNYNDQFDTCLCINCSIKEKFILVKTIQHELIHWMQITLNSETGKTYGKFPILTLKLSPFDKIFLKDLNIDEKYLLDEYEFEPWVANTVEEFTYSGISLEEYIKIIKDTQLFVDTINNEQNQGKREMFIFGELCYITSNRKDENYWYYLIEALKEN
jgi:hypothetical protein